MDAAVERLRPWAWSVSLDAEERQERRSGMATRAIDAEGAARRRRRTACGASLADPSRKRYTNVITEAGMRKKLSAIGNSLGLVIEKPILELLDFTRDTELDMTTDGERLIIAPVRKGKRERVTAALARALVAHDQSLRKLAK